MRSHVRDKGHKLKGDDVRWGKLRDEDEGKRDREGLEHERRPNKRRKVETPIDLDGKGKWAFARDDGLDPDMDGLHGRVVRY